MLAEPHGFEDRRAHGAGRCREARLDRRGEAEPFMEQVLAGDRGQNDCREIRGKPARYRRQIMTGNQVLLLSKVAHVLTEAEDKAIEAGELVKLASVLRSAAQASQRPLRGKPMGRKRREPDLLDLEDQTGSVRMVYGLSYPLPESQAGELARTKEKL